MAAVLWGIGWAMGAPLLGWYSDRIGRRKPIVICGTLLSLSVFMVIVYSGLSAPALLAVLFFVNGFGASGMVVSFGSVRELNPASQISAALGLLNMFVVASGAVMQPLLGWILDLNWTGDLSNGARIYGAPAYTLAFTVLVFGNLISLLCGLILRETYCSPSATHD